MSHGLVIVLTAGLVATACGLLGPFLVLRGAALLGDAVAHSVLPGIVAVYVLFATRAPLPVIVGAAAFGVGCVLAVEAVRATGLVRFDAAIGLVFPALFALGVLGVHHWADGVHLDLDSTIYGQIAWAPFQVVEVGGVALSRSVLLIGAVALLDLAVVALLWRRLTLTTFDAEFARAVGVSPAAVTRPLLVAVAITAVTAFESVGAILVIAMLIVPAATARLLTDRLAVMVPLAAGIGWAAAIGGYAGALRLDASIAGAMGVVATACFAVALVAAPRHGLLAGAIGRRRAAGARPRGATPTSARDRS